MKASGAALVNYTKRWSKTLKAKKFDSKPVCAKYTSL
jgi:hypothetical protein